MEEKRYQYELLPTKSASQRLRSSRSLCADVEKELPVPSECLPWFVARPPFSDLHREDFELRRAPLVEFRPRDALVDGRHRLISPGLRAMRTYRTYSKASMPGSRSSGERWC